ncbi:hypothetical protein ACFYWU_34850 [Streptomyces chrestomyceticus]|uniref:hypothetical protein n=1 Tax=Streptomyces chrestomyceticus TaxID=68185 RepID=UPI0019D1803A|nr:hypothetical protein [Streptomyces chrestomyceticus]
MPGNRTVRRAALAAALSALAVTAPAGSSATAAPAPAPAGDRSEIPARSGRTDSAVDRVAHFYGSYLDAVTDDGRGALAQALRGHYLTPELRARLANWEQREHADGVLRGQDTPTAWRVTYNDSAMGRAWTRVRLTWGGPEQPRYTHLLVTSDLHTLRITDIEPDTGQ